MHYIVSASSTGCSVSAGILLALAPAVVLVVERVVLLTGRVNSAIVVAATYKQQPITLVNIQYVHHI